MTPERLRRLHLSYDGFRDQTRTQIRLSFPDDTLQIKMPLINEYVRPPLFEQIPITNESYKYDTAILTYKWTMRHEPIICVFCEGVQLDEFYR